MFGLWSEHLLDSGYSDICGLSPPSEMNKGEASNVEINVWFFAKEGEGKYTIKIQNCVCMSTQHRVQH
jgi:hypothetical protein